MVRFMDSRIPLRAVGCAAAVIGVLLAFPASGLASSSTCHKRGKTIAHTATARVFRYGIKAVPYVDGGDPIKRPAYYGCRFKTGIPRRLVLEGDGPGRLKLVGDFAGFVSGGVDGGFSWLVLSALNLRTGKRMDKTVPNENDTIVPRVLFTAKGSIAWSTLEREAEPPLGEIYRVAFQQQVTRLDSGADVDPNSLKRAGATLEWTKGGQPMAAPIS